MSKESISKIYLIIEKIEYIEEIVKNSGSISTALEDLGYIYIKVQNTPQFLNIAYFYKNLIYLKNTKKIHKFTLL
jgi:hypothetical protein